jgi:hypothetical protein
VEPLRLPPRSPNLNAFAERWVRSVKEECVSRLIVFGEASLRRALNEYLEHFHTERNHQGKANTLLFPRRVTQARLDLLNATNASVNATIQEYALLRDHRSLLQQCRAVRAHADGNPVGSRNTDADRPKCHGSFVHAESADRAMAQLLSRHILRPAITTTLPSEGPHSGLVCAQDRRYLQRSREDCPTSSRK